MSNAEAIALTRRQEDGYDSFNEETYRFHPETVTVRGAIRIFKMREEVNEHDGD